ncbi:hypothetical protein D3C80_1907250 [compost metagenome]
MHMAVGDADRHGERRCAVFVASGEAGKQPIHICRRRLAGISDRATIRQRGIGQCRTQGVKCRQIRTEFF